MLDNSKVIQAVQILTFHLQIIESNILFYNEILMCAVDLMLYCFSMINNFYFHH